MKPKSMEIIKAVRHGIQAVRHPILAALADVNTGAMMSATTAGRMPMNIDEITALFFIRSGVRKMAMSRMMMNDGKMVAKADNTAPRLPRSLSPIMAAIFTAKMPGNACAMAKRSRNSVR